MAFKFYYPKIGADSKFALFAKPWFFRSGLEDYFIIRICGIYFWFYKKA
ncbi:MAG: hypothetical protein HQL23_09675 [Candidatus Omnitrophica bacterium]|nr:hypothetical protein [Candidatus Omnitrophota bacterium]